MWLRMTGIFLSRIPKIFELLTMDIYLYCSYTNARLGFCLARLEGNALVPAVLSDSAGERLVNDFFFYDRFRVLWQEYALDAAPFFLKGVGGGVFGMRSLHGTISGREGVVNFMLSAEKEELETLQSTALGILDDPAAFTSALFDCLEIGGSCGYQADGRTLRNLFNSIHRKVEDGSPHMIEQFLCSSTVERILSARRFLRFAVYISSWEQVCEQFGPKLLWWRCPQQAISEAQFLSLYADGYCF